MQEADGLTAAVRGEQLEVFTGLEGKNFATHRSVLLALRQRRRLTEFGTHVGRHKAACLFEYSGDVAVVLHSEDFEETHVHIVLHRVHGTLKDRDATGTAGPLLVDDVHDCVRDNVAGRAVRAVDGEASKFTVGAELNAVMHTGRAYVWGQWVTDSVRLHDLQLRNVETVAGLYGKRVAVTEHTAEENVLNLVKRKAAGDIALLGPFIKVIVIGFASLGRRRMTLVLDAVAHGVEREVVKNLIEQPAVSLGPATLTDHRQAVERREVAAEVTRLGAVLTQAEASQPRALPATSGGLGLRGSLAGLDG